MKTNTFLRVNSNNASAGSNRVPRYTGRHMVTTTPSNETLQVFERQTNHVTVIDCEKRKVREYEYRSRIHITELRIPSAAFFPDLDVDEGIDSSTCSWCSEPSYLNRRPNKRQALSLDTSTDTTRSIHTDTLGNEYDYEERDSDSNDEIIDILSWVPRLKLKRRTMTSNPKDAHPHIILEENEK